MGYEIWGFLVMLTYDNDVRKIKIGTKILGFHSEIPIFRAPQTCPLRYLLLLVPIFRHWSHVINLIPLRRSSSWSELVGFLANVYI